MSSWTINDLQGCIREALSYDYKEGPDKRVSGIPTARTIRYYTTQGLIDPPELISGNSALYGKRHLLQLVAIKRLQAEGNRLAQIQEHIAGADNRKLKKIAKLPTEEQLEKAKRSKEKFWSAAPTQPELPHRPEAFKLIDGVIVTIEAPREILTSDFDAITTAAVPLVKTLRQRGLLP